MGNFLGIATLGNNRVKGLFLVFFLVSLAEWFRSPLYVIDPMIQQGFGTSCSPLYPSCHGLLIALNQTLSSWFGELYPRVFQALLLLPVEVGVFALLTGRGKTAYWAFFVVFLVRASSLIFRFPVLNYDLYDIVFMAVLLIARDKLGAARLTYVFVYFLCSTIKFDEGWIFGQYFSTLKEGFPLLGSNPILLAAAGNVIIVAQLGLGWALFSRNSKIRSAAIGFFVLFHIYSTMVVGLRFPLSTLPLLLLLFWQDSKSNQTARLFPEHVDLRIVIFLACLCIFQVARFGIPGQEKLSFEGGGASFFMFDGNHQCAVGYEERREDGSFVTIKEFGNIFAQHRCSVYVYLNEGKRLFCSPSVQSRDVRMTVFSSLNGSPFYRIVNRQPVCSTSYNPFLSNAWVNIKNPPAGAWALQNIYGNRYGSGAPLKYDSGLNVASDPRFQSTSHAIKRQFKDDFPRLLSTLEVFYWTIFLIITLVFFRKISKGYF